MAEHRIVISNEKTWPDRKSTSHRVHCEGCQLNVKIVGTEAAAVVDMIAARHPETGH